MAGEAKTTKFLIGEATLMVGPQAKAFDLVPDTHSLGLVKNLAIQVTTGNAELTQGIQNTPVFSVQNQFTASGSCEVYEYTARNLAYGMGLDATGADYDEPETPGPFTLKTAINAAATSIALDTGAGANFAAGDWVVMQQNEDTIYCGKVASIETDTLTVATATPADVTWDPATTRVFRAKAIPAAGGQTVFLSAKAVVIMPGSNVPVPVIFPKIRITKGFSLSVQTNDYGNLPFEFTPYPLVASDPLYNEFGKGEIFKVLSI